MADQTLRTGNKIGSESQAAGLERTAGAAKSATEEAISAGRGMKDKAAEMAGSSSDQSRIARPISLRPPVRLLPRRRISSSRPSTARRTPGPNMLGALRK